MIGNNKHIVEEQIATKVKNFVSRKTIQKKELAS